MYGNENAQARYNRWQKFYTACSELFAYGGGDTWGLPIICSQSLVGRRPRWPESCMYSQKVAGPDPGILHHPPVTDIPKVRIVGVGWARDSVRLVSEFSAPRASSTRGVRGLDSAG